MAARAGASWGARALAYTKGGKSGPNKGVGKGCGNWGTCYNCGVVGHKAAECTWTPQRVQEVDKEGQESGPSQQGACAVSSELGGVWSINAVTKKVGQGSTPRPEAAAKESGDPYHRSATFIGDWQLVRGRWKKKEPWMPITCNRNPVKVTLGNFGVLGVQDVDCGELCICPVGDERRR